MAWKKDEPNVTGLYMEDISRYSMLTVPEEITVGRRARLGYGAHLAITVSAAKLDQVAEALESGGVGVPGAKKEIRAIVRRVAKLRKQRVDFDAKAVAEWPESERWLAEDGRTAMDAVLALVGALGDALAGDGLEPDTAAALVRGTVTALGGSGLQQTHAELLERGHEAVNELVVANARFVIAVAKKYQNKGLELSALISAGNEGLIKAARKFDERMGVRYVSYAAFWISQQIQKELDYSVGAIRPTQTQMVRNRRVWRIVAEARREGREATIREIQEKTRGPNGDGYTEDRIREALDTSIAIMSLDAPVDRGDAGSTTFAQFIGAQDEGEEKEKEEETERRDAVIRAIRDVLTPREAKIIMLYFGIGGQEEWPLADIGESLNISRERARQLKDRALGKLASCRYTAALFEVSGVEEVGPESVVRKVARSRTAEEMARAAADREQFCVDFGLADHST